MSHSYIGTSLKEKLLDEQKEHKPSDEQDAVIPLENVDLYSGFVGLQTIVPDFQNHIMSPQEILNFFKAAKRYEAPFVYPFLPSDGFDKPVIFSSPDIDMNATEFKLKAEVTTNKHPHSFLSWFASVLLPKAYIMTDQIKFFKNDEQGFGMGSYYITTVDCRRSDGKEACIAKACLSVSNRPGLFLKIFDNQNQRFYENIAIFFPDKIQDFMHKPVQYGEAFVLVPENLALNRDLIDDIRRTFNKLVKKSYGEGEGLYSVITHSPIDNFVEVHAEQLRM